MSTPAGGSTPLAQQGEQHSTPHAGSRAGGRLPVAQRERKPALAAVAVLLVLAGALASGLLVIRSGDRVSAIEIAKPVAPGARISLDAMREVQVAADSEVENVPWAQRNQVARYYAKVRLVPGTLLTPAMVTSDSAFGVGQLVVGLALKPGQLPAQGVAKGDHVRLYAVGTASGSDSGGAKPGTTLAKDAIVYEVATPDSDLGSGTTMVSVAVGQAKTPALTQAASTGAVAVALLPPHGGQ
ncbi:MAG: hypothetical protein ACRDN9_11340 [Streptosporangiaceae bacterium]